VERCRVKICGITSIEDAQMVARAGAYAIGVNLIAESKRFVPLEQARAIALAVRGQVLTVAVVADRSADEIRALSKELPDVRFQLHGFEPLELVEELGSLAFKALRIGDSSDVAVAARCPGDPLLVDARVPGELGGTGQSFDWQLVEELSQARRLIVAGGLTPDNVAAAVAQGRPFAVDVASGVEVPGDPRRKDPERVRRFIDGACGV
jgi:phosphoribosylanthranilate isomerase